MFVGKVLSVKVLAKVSVTIHLQIVMLVIDCNFYSTQHEFFLYERACAVTSVQRPVYHKITLIHRLSVLYACTLSLKYVVGNIG